MPTSELIYMTGEDYNTITDILANNEVVLFLGPLFGIDEQNKKMNSRFREHLVNMFTLDDEFENLFILKQSKENLDAGDLVTLRTQFKKFYEAQKPHNVYQQISHLKFTAIVNCSQDLFLYKSFDKSKVNFSHFSAKKADPNETVENIVKTKEDKNTKDSDKTEDKLPIVYNVYGSYMDPQSLITDYETFYNFLISLIGANDEIPQKLKTALKKADIFIFLGFNLTRWYIPLLIRKLYKLAENERVSSYATLEDTLRELNIPGMEQLENEEILDAIKAVTQKHDHDKVSGFLNRYPARFRVTNETNVEFIERLTKGEGVLRDIVDPKALLQKKKELEAVRDNLREIHVKGENLYTLQKLKEYFVGTKNNQKADEVLKLEARHNQVNREFKETRMTYEVRDIQIKNVSDLILDMVNSIVE
jgi:hypothetical protein